MTRILVVEDSKFFGAVIRNRISSELGFDTVLATNFFQAKALMASGADSFDVAVLDLRLPDAPDGRVLDEALAAGIPAVVLTGEWGDETRDTVWQKRVVDYVVKDGPHAVDYVLDLLRRVAHNHKVEILVVDDSAVARAYMTDLLAVQRYQVLQACCGEEALEVLREHPEIQLMFVDHHMPGMDGFQLTRKVRARFPRDRLAIVGISAHGSGHLSAKFIKCGANDFLHKPFITEELYCRVSQNLLQQEHVRALEETANRDFLTKLYNRRYFFAVGHKMFANAQRGNITLSLAMLDIDFFKKINDTYGHEAGDEVLKHVARILDDRFRASDIVARFGGEEFCVLGANMDKNHAPRVFDELRARIEKSVCQVGGESIRATLSIGVTTALGPSLDEMIAKADGLLYEAKESGRNKVVFDG